MAKIRTLSVQRLEEAAECRANALEILRRALREGLRGDVNEYMRLKSVRQMIGAARDVHGVWVQEQVAHGRLAYLEEKRKGAYYDRRVKEERMLLAREKADIAREALALRREELEARRAEVAVGRRVASIREKKLGGAVANAEREARRRAEIEREHAAACERLARAEEEVAHAQAEARRLPAPTGPGVGEDAGVQGARGGAVEDHVDSARDVLGEQRDPAAARVHGEDRGADPGADPAVGASASGVGDGGRDGGADAGEARPG